MPLSEKIKQAAQALGRSLREEGAIRAYFDAVEMCRADSEATALEGQLYATYNDLIARQQAGEQLSREVTQAFYDLRRRVQTHPLIARRDNTLQLIKPQLADVADEISAILGVDFTALARAA